MTQESIDGPMPKRNILFVCSANKLRSPTAEAIYKSRTDLDVKSAGTSRSAKVQISSELIQWADYIFVMEDEHTKSIRRKYFSIIRSKRVYCLDIPDEYEFMEPNLVAILTGKLQRYIGDPVTKHA